MFRVFYEIKGKGNAALKKINILTFGYNSLDIRDGGPGIHAEHDAIRKLPPQTNKKRYYNINILVIRISGKNKLQSSKPCSACIKTMNTLPAKMGYKINNVFYSNDMGNIIKTKLSHLNSDTKHLSRYWKLKQYK